MSVVEIWSCYGFNNKWSHSRGTRRCSLWLLLQRAPTKFPLCLQTWRSYVCNDVSCRQPTLWFPLCCLLLNKEAAWLSKPISLLGIFYKYLFNASNFMPNRNGHMAWFEVEKREEGELHMGEASEYQFIIAINWSVANSSVKSLPVEQDKKGLCFECLECQNCVSPWHGLHHCW